MGFRGWRGSSRISPNPTWERGTSADITFFLPARYCKTAKKLGNKPRKKIVSVKWALLKIFLTITFLLIKVKLFLFYN